MLAWGAKFLRYFFRLWSHGAEIVLSSYFNFQKNDFIKLKKNFLININSVMIWFAFWKKRKRKIWEIFGCTLEFFSLEALLSKINSCILLSQYFLSVYFDVNAQNFYVHSSQLNFLFSLFLPLTNFFFMKKEHLRNFSLLNKILFLILF